ncbi:MAG: hypothetical protein M0027_19315 [Candidatus Dormibacteraeota bacterium]|jgi:hypothetical protein|nr:hypothetical protein [Candidatus Dormibacteraeota bacterium]
MAELAVGGDLELKLCAALDASTEQIKRGQDREDRLERLIPIAAQIQASDEFPSSGDLIMDCGGPTLGKAWVLRRVFLGGTDPTATTAGSAFLFLSSSKSSNALISAFCFDQAASLPIAKFYSSRMVVLTYPQRIICKVTGGTAGDSYQLGGLAMEEIANDPVAARWTL